MPVDPSSSAETGARKKKQQVIVVVLLVGLLVAIVTQPKGEQETGVTASQLVVPTLVNSKPLPDAAAAPREEFTTMRELSRLDDDQVLQSSLFYVPPPEPEPKPESVEPEQVAPPEEVTVRAIYGSGHLPQAVNRASGAEHRALIGQVIIRSGEVLPDGRQIVSVSPDGVELGQ